MNILLVNEASGLNSNLKKGLQELGHFVIHASSVDRGWQGRSFDFYFGNPGLSLYAKLKRNLLPFWKIRRFAGFDIVHFVLGITTFGGRFIRYRDLGFFKRNGSLLSYHGVGCDEISLLRVRADADSLPCCRSCMTQDELGLGCEKHILGWRREALKFLDMFDYCITSVCEYDHCHPLFERAKHAKIPVPVIVSEIEFVPAKPKKRPLIIHSPTRRGFKGTQIILAAIEKLKDRTKDFEFKVVEGLAYDRYLAETSDADIYIDQVLSKSPGTSAFENLAMGKIVVSGKGSPEARSYFPFGDELPVIEGSQDPQKLAETLFQILQNQEAFESLAVRGRQYIKKYHDHIKVAQQFLDLWRG